MKIGIMSFAHHHSEAYIANLRAIPGVELCGVADEDPARGARLAAANGAEAMALWKTQRAAIRLLLTDLVMPGGMSGKDLAELLLIILCLIILAHKEPTAIVELQAATVAASFI